MMEKKEFSVQMTVEDSRELELLWYEYNGTCDIIARLTKDKDVTDEMLEKHLQRQELRFVKVEMMKEALAKKYRPEGVDLTKYNQAFDFEECMIVFTEA